MYIYFGVKNWTEFSSVEVLVEEKIVKNIHTRILMTVDILLKIYQSTLMK